MRIVEIVEWKIFSKYKEKFSNFGQKADSGSFRKVCNDQKKQQRSLKTIIPVVQGTVSKSVPIKWKMKL